MVGMVDSEHVVFVGCDPRRRGEPADVSEADQIEWVLLSDVPGLIRAGKIWNAGTLVALLGLVALHPSSGGDGDAGGEVADTAADAG